MSKALTGAITGPRQLLAKLDWEIEQLDKESSVQIQAYQIFNCAVTAWHMCDWVWEALPEAARECIEELPAAEGKTGVTSLQRFVQSQNQTLNICRQIATAMKHVEVGHTGLNVQLSNQAAISIFADDGGEKMFALRGNATFVQVEDALMTTFSVFHCARNYWYQFLIEHDL